MNEIVTAEPRPLALEVAPPAAPMSPTMALISQAVSNGAPIETIERLMALQERMEAAEAERAFVAAMAEFKAAPLVITKNKRVNFSTSKGDTDYTHATLDNIVAVVGPELAKVGLSYRWKTEHLDAGTVRVTCIVRHRLGHSEETTLQAGADNSGGKNTVQAIGSTCTYLQRYTLLAALGLATGDADDDGRGGPSEDELPITMEQVAQLQNALAETGGDVAAFCAWLKVPALADLPRKGFGLAMARLEQKRKQGSGK